MGRLKRGFARQGEEKPYKEIMGKIVASLRAGAYPETAAALAGINRDTLYDWLKKGRGDDKTPPREPFATFAREVEAAMAEAELRDLEILRRAAEDGVWQASAWRLERRWPQRWGRRQEIGITGVEGPIEITLSLRKDNK